MSRSRRASTAALVVAHIQVQHKLKASPLLVCIQSFGCIQYGSHRWGQCHEEEEESLPLFQPTQG